MNNKLDESCYNMIFEMPLSALTQINKKHNI
jgi:hypothetical protein